MCQALPNWSLLKNNEGFVALTNIGDIKIWCKVNKRKLRT